VLHLAYTTIFASQSKREEKDDVIYLKSKVLPVETIPGMVVERDKGE
jgi:hypothetical protein